MKHIKMPGWRCTCGNTWPQRVRSSTTPQSIRCKVCQERSWDNIRRAMIPALQCDVCDHVWTIQNTKNNYTKCTKCYKVFPLTATDLKILKQTG